MLLKPAAEAKKAEKPAEKPAEVLLPTAAKVPEPDEKGKLYISYKAEQSTVTTTGLEADSLLQKILADVQVPVI